ncbi:hypothetical protein BDP27DRAFT_1329870 [Rhodocollybia butyracea]|uniref:Uncharacterized protein n=1 Tax=Rhodocollybia butyracea TaxID=206335 RepID=A0A9P5PRW3_9AGAR|nr:hypothetical protein BDP27DRAFT_1329870 [Rhodocollybia butyracea]
MSSRIMPDVFVFPPEEDNDEPFCCFNAADPLELTEEDLACSGSALEMISNQFSSPDSPVFRRSDPANGGIVMPKRSCSRTIQQQYEDPDMTIRGPGDDSEIIEIIKVRRHKQDDTRQLPPSVSEPAFKPSKSFKSRASRAFSSIKNVGRSVSRSRIPVTDVAEPRAPSPAPSRRGFSSLFSHSPSLRSRSSFDSFNDPPPSPSIEPSSSESIDIRLHSPSSSAEMQGFVPYPDSEDDEDEDDGQLDQVHTTPRASRTLPTPIPPKLSRRRFSVLSLFSASKESEFSDAGPTTPTLPPSMSRDSLGPTRTDSTESSTSSSSGPTTPVDETFPQSLPNRPSISLLKRLPSFSRSPRNTRVAKPESPALEVEADDPSFGEIRLDSLHFDELSFDATRF